MDQSQKQKEQAREPRSMPIGTAIGRKLAAAGIAEKRARQLGNMVEGLTGHLAENSMIARLDVSDLLPMFALMLGSLMAEVAEYQARFPQWAAIVDLEDVRQLIDIPRMPDPDPPRESSFMGMLTGIGSAGPFDKDSDPVSEAPVGGIN